MTIFFPSIVTNGLVLCLDAGNQLSYPGTGTTWNDLSRNGNDGTLTNGPVFNSGGSMVFDGVNDYIAISDSLQQLQFSIGAFTLSAWIYPAANKNHAIISYGSANGYNMYIASGNYLEFAKANVANTGSSNSLTPVNLNKWQYATCVVSINNNVQFFINGVLKRTANFAYSYAYTNQLRIGDSQNESLFWNGNISNVNVYNRALTSQEIFSNYLATKGRYKL